MAQYKYAFNKYAENMARAVGRDLPISTKQAIEICSSIRGMELGKAMAKLERVIAYKQAVPYKRFTEGAGHKPGMASGKYPVKACTHILKILKSVESNSQNKSLGTVMIKHICAQGGGKRWHYGRKRRIKMKRSHIEIVVEEIKESPKAKKPQEKKTAEVKETKKPAKEEKK